MYRDQDKLFNSTHSWPAVVGHTYKKPFFAKPLRFEYSLDSIQLNKNAIYHLEQECRKIKMSNQSDIVIVKVKVLTYANGGGPVEFVIEGIIPWGRAEEQHFLRQKKENKRSQNINFRNPDSEWKTRINLFDPTFLSDFDTKPINSLEELKENVLKAYEFSQWTGYQDGSTSEAMDDASSVERIEILYSLGIKLGLTLNPPPVFEEDDVNWNGKDGYLDNEEDD